MSKEKQVQPAPVEFKRDESFLELYSNNTQFLSSNWDLEIVFGKLDLKQGPNVVAQNASITMPWAQAKVLSYFLQLHVTAHEADFGRIIIPKGIIPEFPTKAPKGGLVVDEKAWAGLRKRYEEFIATNPEAKP